MNSRSHVPGALLQGSVPAPNSPYLLSNALAGRLDRKDAAWWCGLTVTARTREAGVDHLEVTDADKLSWRILLADWNTPQSERLQSEAAIALTLGSDLAEPPQFRGEQDRFALIYAPRAAQVLADRPSGSAHIEALLDLALAASETLMRVHEAGITHGGLSPKRMLVAPEGAVRLTDFAAVAALEGYAAAGDLRLSGGDMAYAAPELIRTAPFSADARTDLYALGVILYEQLVGALPLQADSLPGWLHAHVAMEAPSARLVRPDIPAVLDRILLKLLSKDPKHRYQTARALHADFRRVATSLATGAGAADFVLARGEFAEPSGRPGHLVGRERELETLSDLYAAFRAGSNRRIVLVTGEPGAGKSTLVDALLKELDGTNALCVAGKGVQLRQGTPFAPVVQALRTALAHFMGGEEAALEAARARLCTIVGGSRALADLVPDLAFLPPEAPALGDVPAHLAQVRSARILAETFGALASADAPLVLFLDDLQWFDHASINVVRQLCSAAPAHVFLIASARSDARNRRLVRDLLEGLGRAPDFAREVHVQPLREQDTTALVAHILKSTPPEIRPIAARIHRETDGNPFYIGQLLRRFLDARILRFDMETQSWTSSEEPSGEPHEMADLMTERIKALPDLQRRFLQRSATLGGRCSTAFAAQLSGAGLDETVRAAHALVAAGLLVRSEGDFAIAHDRVLEAAYATLSQAERARCHLGNARQLLAADPAPGTEWAFDVASQIERCDPADFSAGEGPSFARILLLAARKCRSAGEADRAVHLVELIRRVLPVPPPEEMAALVFDAEWLHCDGLLALGRVDEALAALDALPRPGDDPVALADIYRLKAFGLTVKSAYDPAIAAALAGLRTLGMDLATSATPEELEAAYRRCRHQIDTLTHERLMALPEMTDRTARAAMSLLSTLIAAFFVKGDLRFLHVIKIVELTLAYGTAPETAYGLGWFGVQGALYFGDYERGTEDATAARALALRDGYEAQRTAALIALDQISAWTRPMRTALSHAREGARIGQAAGDHGMVCYARNHIASDLLAIGTRLDLVRSELSDSIAMTREIGYADIEWILQAQLDFVEALRTGEMPGPVPDPDLKSASVATQFWVKHFSGLRFFLLGHFETALTLLEEAEAMAWAAAAHVDTANTCFFLALAHAHIARPDLLPEDRLRHMSVARDRFRFWAALNAETFSCRHLLLEAEAARLAGQRAEAMDLYERAARAAAGASFVHEQALAQELAARFYRDMGLHAPAQGCLQAALQGYQEWGAQAKADQLAASVGAGAGTTPSAPFSTARRIQQELDLTVMTAASQTLAEEVGLEQVVRTLMKSMLVHAGAQFGLLLLLRDGAPASEAVARVSGQAIDIAFRPAQTPEDLMPAAVLKTVLRTRRPVTLADAASEAPQRGLSLGGRPIRSLACIPLIKRGELIGMLYMENALSADVFTPQRMAMLEVLAPQAAISLDAARLYGDLMDENLRRAQAEFDLREARSDLARANQLTAMGSFATSVAHEINQPLASLVAQAEAGLRWLHRPKPDLAEVSNSLESIRKSGRRAADIITALRALVKQAPSPTDRVAVEDMLDEVLKILAPEFATHGIAPVLVAPAARHEIQANPIQIQQVFFNLITNAIQSMAHRPAGARELRICVSARGDMVEIAFADTGCGMPQEIAARIFQPFFTTKTSGMGVGLAICRSIMELHAGTLEVRSTEGQGSTFFVRLPRDAPPASPLQ
ncbi:MAG: AAA family ATPase [Pseudomonadota bacterium]